MKSEEFIVWKFVENRVDENTGNTVPIVPGGQIWVSKVITPMQREKIHLLF